MSTMNDRCTQHLNQLLELQLADAWQKDIESLLVRGLTMPDTELTLEQRTQQNERYIMLMCTLCKQQEISNK
ncbi:hypothetical protein C5O19_09555 [Siphonobacter curvatus]|uniref:Uncharacterized protein n=1 Tax=Siphonobacter curvatus TaxID=2094562 RepID=A0A2S7IQ52_9BACT|nr:hypothetical protein C5O19_09555 [Siphonobacter curvatus]